MKEVIEEFKKSYMKHTLIYNKCLTNFSHNQGNINATILQKYCRFKSHGITRKMQIGD